MIPAILLLGGAPGSGKSTVARLFANRAAVVEVDDLRGELHRIPSAAALTSSEVHHVALAQAATIALAFLSRGERQVVVVDTFGLSAFHAFFRALRGRAVVKSVSLVVDLGEHARRLETRPEVPGVFRDLEAARKVDAEHHLNRMTERIDTTRLTPGDVAARILSNMFHTTNEESA